MSSLAPSQLSHPWIRVDGAIIRVTMPEWVTLPQIEEYEAAMLSVCAEVPGPRAIVTDTRALAPINSVLRRRFADIIDKLAPYHHECAASAVLVSNPFFKGALTAVHWLSPPAFPQRAFTNVEAAETWVDVLLKRAQRGPKIGVGG